MGPLPSWLGISRLGATKEAGHYHSAVMIDFNLQAHLSSAEAVVSSAEAVVYSPHGVLAKTLSHLPEADPPLTILALLHGLYNIKLMKMQFNLGAHNGLEVQRLCNAKYWVATHDEEKKAKGIVAPFLNREISTVQEALEREKSNKQEQLAPGPNRAPRNATEICLLRFEKWGGLGTQLMQTSNNVNAF